MAVIEETWEVVDVRCPNDPRQLLMRYAKTEGHISSDNLMMLHCRTCSRNVRQSDPTVQRVIHHFDLAATLVQTTVERRPAD